MEFLRRMQKYKDQGIRHFYFMALAREEVGSSRTTHVMAMS